MGVALRDGIGRRRGEWLIVDGAGAGCGRWRRGIQEPGGHGLAMASDSNVVPSEAEAPITAADAVNLGVDLVSKGRVQHGIAPAPFHRILLVRDCPPCEQTQTRSKMLWCSSALPST